MYNLGELLLLIFVLQSRCSLQQSNGSTDDVVFAWLPRSRLNSDIDLISTAEMSVLTPIYIFIRLYLDKMIDFFFSLYWEGKKKVIPDLEKKHAFLAESATSLAKKIKQKELKSEELVQALIERIKQVNPHLNAIAADRFEAALEEAREVDRLISEGLTEELSKKPFLGVPYTAKESQAVKGMPLTLGLWCRRNETATEDSEAVVRMRAAGAIIVASTNLPEMLIWQETRNPVYGMTTNPHHTGRSPGGSSGAEAALSSTYATPISLCSDIGGSTRMPAFYCGMFGHHPTAGTTNTKGCFYRNGDEDSMFCLGFISKHVEDLAPLTKIVAGDKADLLKLDRDVDIKKIKFYYVETSKDGHVSPLRPEMTDAMQSVVKKIQQDLNASPQSYYHDGLDYMYKLWCYWMSKEPGNYASMLNNGVGEMHGFRELFKKMFGLSKHCLFTIMQVLEKQLLPKPDEEWAENLTKSFKEDLFGKLGDNGVLLFPSAPHASPYNYSCYLRPYNFSYWSLVNVLKCPATQVPLGKNSQGLPIGIQVVAAPYNDALCLAVAKYLEKEFGGAIAACKVK
ncbi:fatty-acid amide hydrolase 2-A-like isoform X2 [Maniola jurtina]|uniref:fatty-acid amide hydrolase 2-A-like isoform X2 n=1 Tax=Maniola jurtina TaxID=191418 RepID=UPI001E68D9E9|nr:fatty-acid amide hydrolase 2-A-like isoform X2 [Maniola jurtina]